MSNEVMSRRAGSSSQLECEAKCWTVEVTHTYEGTDTVQALIVGREITGEQAFAH